MHANEVFELEDVPMTASPKEGPHLTFGWGQVAVGLLLVASLETRGVYGGVLGASGGGVEQSTSSGDV